MEAKHSQLHFRTHTLTPKTELNYSGEFQLCANNVTASNTQRVEHLHKPIGPQYSIKWTSYEK